MELNFEKEKSRIAKLSDAELVARSRDPALNPTDRMLIEAEISQRQLNSKHFVEPRQTVTATKPSSGSKWISLLFIVIFVGTILMRVLDDMGIDIWQWLSDLFSFE